MLNFEQLIHIIENSKQTVSKDEAENEFRKLAANRCDELLSPYVNNRTKIKMRNTLTGKEFEVTPLAYKKRRNTIPRHR